MERRINKKVKRLELIKEATKKTYHEAEEITIKKRKLEEDLKKKETTIQIEEAKVDTEVEINKQITLM